MFKQKLLPFSAGFIAATILTSSVTTVFAAPIEKQITAFFNNIKIYVDGNLVKPTDGNGNPVEPLIYNGTTYLPVRAVGQALNKNVNWDGKTNSVYIGKTNESEFDIHLSSLDYLSEGHQIQWGHVDWKSYSDNRILNWDKESNKDNAGNTYNNGLLFDMQGDGTGSTYGLESEREYLLNQKYKRFKGTFVLHYDSRSSEDAHAVLKIYGDDELLYTSDVLEKGVLPIKFDVDTTGVVKLKIVITNTGSNMDYSDHLYFGIVNAGFVK